MGSLDIKGAFLQVDQQKELQGWEDLGVEEFARSATRSSSMVQPSS